MRIRVFFAALLLAALLQPATTHAQLATARLTVSVADPAGTPVAGLTIDVVGDTGRQAVTDAHGDATFTRVVPGRYRVTATQSGAARQELSRIDVMGGADLRVTLVLPGSSDPGARGRWVVVDASPSISATVTSGEIDRLPVTGDVWSVLKSLPAIAIDRVNVGGSESVAQPAITANGAPVSDNVWTIDGVPVTNVSTLGLSTAYAGLSLLDDVRATTGAYDPSIATSGIGVSLQLKSGTDTPRSSAYASIGSHAFIARSPAGSSTSGIDTYRRLDRDVDGGLEIGGPFSGRTLFGWGGYDVLTPALDVFNRQGASFATAGRDSAVIQSGAFKLAWVKNADTRLTFTYFGSRRARDGEDAGPFRPMETSLDARATSQFGAVRLDRVVGRNLSITARYALAPATTSFEPDGGRGAVAYQDDAGVWHNSYQFARDHQLQHVLAIDADYRWHGQDLRLGADLRRVSIDDATGWPGGQFDLSSGYPVLLAEAVRDRRSLGHALYLDAYVGDTWRWGRLTLDAGVRWDRQAGSIDAVTIDANPIAPGALPALDVPAQSNAIVWSLVSPRASAAFALDASQRTVLRATYARFASPLSAAFAPLIGGAPLTSVALVTAIDKNGDHVLSAGDVSTSAGGIVSNTRIDSVSAPRTDAFAGEITRTTAGGLTIRAAATFRRSSQANWLHLDGVTGAKFSPATTLTTSVPPIQGASAELFRVNGAEVPADLLQTYESRAGYSSQFLGFEASVARQSAGRIAWRIGFSSGQTTDHFDSIDAHYDPTPSPPAVDPFSLASPNVDGGDVAFASIDSNGRMIFATTPRYQWFAAATIDLPWRFQATPAYFLREGFALPYFAALPGAADASSPDGKTVLLTGTIAAFRLPPVHELDVRFSRPIALMGRASFLDVDVFNVLNRATPLARQLDTRAPGFNDVTETMSPLAVRVGVRIAIR